MTAEGELRVANREPGVQAESAKVNAEDST